MKVTRTARVERKTRETEISLKLNLDGDGDGKIDTTIPFFDHMLELLTRHGGFDLEIKASGDTQIDYHHLIEDVGLALGRAFNEAAADKKGIERYGAILLPMDEALVQVAVDISGRPFLYYNGPSRGKIGKPPLRVGLVEEFLRAFVMEARITLHIDLLYGQEIHHKIEAIFKGLGKALHQAVAINPGTRGIPSTKGIL